MYFIMLLMMTIPAIFMFLSHPISLSMMIFIQIILISLMCSTISNLMWFSYMLFLVMIGGLLILFLYMTNVASNEKFKPSKKIKMICLSSAMIALMIPFMDNFFFFSINSLWNFKNFQDMETTLMKFYNFPSMTIMIMIMIYLLMTMIMTVKLTDIKKGALRQKN